MTSQNSSSTELRPDRRGAFLLLFFCLLAVGAGNTMLIGAVLPPLIRELELPDWTAGAIFSLSALAWSVFSPVWGQKSNEWGRRRVAALGMFGFAVSMALFAVAAFSARAGWTVGWFLIFITLLSSRTLFGIFGSGTNPAAQAYVADRTAPEERLEEISTLTAGFSVGTVVGPAIAAVLIMYFGLLSPMVFISVVAIALGSFVLFRLPENQRPNIKRVEGQDERQLWRDPSVAPFLIYAVGLSLVSGVLTQTFPFAMMDKMGLEGEGAAQYLGPVMTVGAMATLIAQLVIIPRMKLSARDLMVSGAVLLVIGSVFMTFAGLFAMFAFVQMLFGLGQGLSRPGFTSAASLAAGPEAQGNVAGLITAANGTGFVISPFFGPWMYQYVSPAAPFIFCACVLSVMGVYAWFKASHSRMR